jgi:shikimate kinase
MKTIENKKTFDKIYLVGMPAAGKTHLAHELSKWLRWKLADTDKLIEKKIGMSVAELFQLYGESEFRQLERQVLEETREMKNCVIATGGGLPCFFDNNQILRENGLIIFLDTELEILARRISGNISKRPLFGKSDNIAQKLSELYDKRFPFYSQAHLRLSGEWSEAKFFTLMRISEYNLEGFNF